MYFENFSQVQSSTSNATIMFHNGEGQSDENTNAAALCICLYICGAGYLSSTYLSRLQLTNDYHKPSELVASDHPKPL